ncbi:hypothetical protein DIPPA_16940 [Diplonema papillatum]|nr:hypothetical protein DIPPA_16940 [Diplonema papillatum]
MQRGVHNDGPANGTPGSKKRRTHTPSSWSQEHLPPTGGARHAASDPSDRHGVGCVSMPKDTNCVPEGGEGVAVAAVHEGTTVIACRRP